MSTMQVFKLFWPLFAIIFIIGVLKIIFSIYFNKEEEKRDLSVYEIKPFLFDSKTELDLFKILLELYRDEYYIFTQINYSHLIRPRKSNWVEERKLRSRIDRKSADFVLCDKEHVIPKLIIELDGYVHNFRNKQTRDEFINNLTKAVNLPILHLKIGNMTKDFIKDEITKMLKK